MSKCLTTLGLAASGLALALSPGLIFEIPHTDAHNKIDKAIGFRTMKTNIYAIISHAIIFYALWKFLLEPMFNKCENGAPSALQRRYASNLRNFVEGDDDEDEDYGASRSTLRSFVVDDD
jgi:hypothetical protein